MADLTDITIPPEAIEAAARKLARDTEGTDEWWTLYMRRARAACLAMLRAWPGAGTVATEDCAGVWRQMILPITENSNG